MPITTPARAIALSALVPLSAAISASALAAPFFMGLGDLAGGDERSQALAISADGLTVVGDSDSTDGAEAFRWTLAGGMAGLGDLAGGVFRSLAYDVSADGSVIVGFSVSGASGGFPEGFRWTQSTNMVGLGDLAGGFFFSEAHCVSADGSIIGGLVSTTDGTEAMRWVLTDAMTGAGTMTALGDLAGGDVNSVIWSMTPDGALMVGRGSVAPSGVNPQTEAFRWTQAGGIVTLGDLPGGLIGSQARGVSADGVTIVGYASTLTAPQNAREGFRWTQGGGMIAMGDLAGGNRFSEANAASADGTVIVGYATTGLGNEAFIWMPVGGLRNLKSFLQTDSGLDLTGWTLTAATDITPDGFTIVGLGVNPMGLQEAWIAKRRAPCPADFDGDGMVGSADLAIMLGVWGAMSPPQGDLNGDGMVTAADLSLLLGAWGACP